MPEIDDKKGIIVLVPIFNDWTTALELVRNIKTTLSSMTKTRVILVDDGSTEQADLSALKSLTDSHLKLEIIKLVTNIGHQRAIAIGLAAIEQDRTDDTICVIDGDGEDNPEHIPKLLAEMSSHEDPPIVMAQRNRRTEGMMFRLGYACFKILHRVLTGKSCDVGNFSLIPSRWLKSLAHAPELWNHYSATIISSRIPIEKVACPRSQRYSGQSKMNITSLVVHGLRAISVFGETVGVRIGIALGSVATVTFAALVGVVLIRLLTDLAIPGWATNATGLLLILCLNLLMLTAMSLMFILGARSTTEFIPARDWTIFVDEWKKMDE